jgi:hypothetical protein
MRLKVPKRRVGDTLPYGPANRSRSVASGWTAISSKYPPDWYSCRFLQHAAALHELDGMDGCSLVALTGQAGS